MKEGWKMVKLGEVSSFQNGFAFKSSLFKNEGEPIIRISNIQDEKLSTNDLVYFNPKDYKVNFDQYRIFPNDILIAMSGGTTGKLGINQDNRVYYQNQRVGVIREKADVLCRQYLYYFLQTKTEESLKIAAGAAQPNLSTAQINNFDLPLPPLEEQHRIVSTLDVSIEKIDALKKNAEENLKNTKALFQQVLAQELKPKEGWVEKKLGEICEITSSKRIFKNEYTENGIPFYRTKELKELAHGRNISLELFISESRYNDIKAKFGVPQIGDILISAVGTIGETLIIDNVNPFYFKDGNIVWLRKINGVNSNFLKISIDSIVEKLKSITRGAAYNALTIEKLKEMQITYPILEEEQINILSTIQTLSEKCRRLEQIAQQTILECDALKQSILRQAFSGEL